MLSPIVEHTAVWKGVGGRGEIWRAIPQWNTKDHLPKPQQQLLRPRSGPSKAAHTRTTGVKEQQVVYWANIEKRIKLILKTIGNRKGDCAWSCSRWQTQPENISKLQSTNQYNVRSEWHWFVRCNLQIFSGCVCHLEQLHAQSPLLFPIVFSINLFTCFRIVCGDTGRASVVPAVGSKSVICPELETITVLVQCASLAGANFRLQFNCRRVTRSAMSLQRSSEEDSRRLSRMCCCCFQSVTRLRTFKPHWLGPPMKRMEGFAHFGSPTYRLRYFVAIACNLLTNDQQRSLISKGRLSFDATKWW